MSEQEKPGQSEQDKKVVRANIAADETTRRGVYSTQALVSHTGEEFVFDFCFFAPTHPMQGQLVSRVVMSPAHAKRFIGAVQENLRRYEAKHGEIQTPEQPQNLETPPTVQ